MSLSPKLQRLVSEFLPITVVAVVVLAPWIIATYIEERRERRSTERKSA